MTSGVNSLLPGAVAFTALIRLGGVTKSYGALTALKDISLDVSEGEFLTLLGPSGSGKTTSHMYLAGFEFPTSGTVVYAYGGLSYPCVLKRAWSQFASAAAGFGRALKLRVTM